MGFDSAANDTPSTFETPSSIILSALHKASDQDSTPSVRLPDAEIHVSKSSDTMSVMSGSSARTSKSSREPEDMGLNEFFNTFTSEDNQSFNDIVEETIRKHKLKVSFIQAEKRKLIFKTDKNCTPNNTFFNISSTLGCINKKMFTKISCQMHWHSHPQKNSRCLNFKDLHRLGPGTIQTKMRSCTSQTVIYISSHWSLSIFLCLKRGLLVPFSRGSLY